jgi:formylglycine-generating enzyme required for sulfatase activity
MGDPQPRSQEPAGVTVVGSYPAGASRDGLRDLVGDVCTWCSDWYQPYGEADQTDPCGQTPSNYRVIRGGSWDYYGGSGRSRAREFNNPNYGGYIYLGLRLALPEAGFRKVQALPAGVPHAQP